MSAEHTPGPWQVGPEYHNHSRFSVYHVDFSPVASFVPTEADARLIAAAPDLLAALQECESALADIVNASDNGEPYTDEELKGFAYQAASKAALAIAKAGVS